nr:hypothetical protein [Rhodococcus sp. HNM0569]
MLALIGLVTVLVLLWKAFGPRPSSTVPPRVKGPDDDAEFLWRVTRDTQRRRTDERGDSGTPETD